MSVPGVGKAILQKVLLHDNNNSVEQPSPKTSTAAVHSKRS